MTAHEIRQAFLEFFKSRQHQLVPSAPIVVKNDPTLMFTNAGMNQFKDYFLGNEKAPFARAADTQKCLRVSGKHNDLEEVGVDTYHHTMFEMLGNWSFGDYFKKEAIAWSWELLTEVLKIPVDRLYVTVFEGDEKEGLPADKEAIEEWKKWIDPARILKGKKKDNFWEMGDTGPCGPCTEIHVDSREDEERQQMDGASLVNADHPQVIEIWNNVFIQYNRAKDGSLQQLPARHVDTGMGFERLVRVLQQKHSNYDTDIFSGTIQQIEKITGKTYNSGATPISADWKEAVAIRVNADHLRAISFTIADGQLPSNTGAGYVIRRILRRAVRYYYSYLDYKQPLLFKLVPVLASQFEAVFPELKKQEAFVVRVVKEEEEAFLRTLEKGLKRIEDIIAASPEMIGGKEAFELNDTYGFPLDLTRLIAMERNISVDEPGFLKAMQEQKERSRAATATDAGDWIILKEGNSSFTGYQETEGQASLLRYRKVKSKGKEVYQLVLDKTPFYAESGGQVGDTGTLSNADETIAINDTKKENDLIVHLSDKLPENLEALLTARIDAQKRNATAVHHSTTHLLHAALRQVLGHHVAQKGSLVNADYLRFDFSHFSKMTAEELREVERMVNDKIRQNIPVTIRTMPREEAMKSGAMALFGEKYGAEVRVVTMDPAYSVELCGGTHITATGALGYFRIVSEGAVAAGVRRIEAVSGQAAQKLIEETFLQSQAIREILNNPPNGAKAVETLLEENNHLKKQLEKLEAEKIHILAKTLAAEAELIHDVSFVGRQVQVNSADSLKKLAFEIKQQLETSAIILTADIEGKAAVVISFSQALCDEKGLDAGSLIKQKIAPLIKGGGGGQKSLATAGGQQTSQLHEVITAVKALI